MSGGRTGRGRKAEEGQGLLLFLAVMGTFALTLIFFSLQRSQQGFKKAVGQSRRTQVIYVLDSVARWLQYIYYHEASCDPYLLNNLINHLSPPAPAGSGGPAYALPTNRVYVAISSDQSLDPSATPYLVSIGEFYPGPAQIQNIGPPLGTGAVPPAGSYSLPAGVSGVFGSQDVAVTYWVSALGSFSGASSRSRYEQTIVLLNTCSVSASSGAPYSTGPQFAQPGQGVSNPSQYFAAQPLNTLPNLNNANCGSSGLVGDLNGDGAVDVQDLMIFEAVVKNGPSGWANFFVNGQSLAPGLPSVPCLDLNRDQVVNEIDLNILQKSLKGYLYYYIPTYEPVK